MTTKYKNLKNKKHLSERGSILIYSVLIMITVMVISLTLLRSFIPRLKIAGEAVSSVVALYATDSALEWCLYSNRHSSGVPAQPTISVNTSVTYQIFRGSTSNISTCPSGETVDYRAQADYRGISRSLQILE